MNDQVLFNFALAIDVLGLTTLNIMNIAGLTDTRSAAVFVARSTAHTLVVLGAGIFLLIIIGSPDFVLAKIYGLLGLS